jgi:lysine-specific demethylase/histidyl-hydroxylase NO66
MFTLDELLHPITRDQFDADYNDRKPLHIPAGDGAPKRALLDWVTFNALLDQSSIWTAQSLKMVFNGQPIPPEQYCIEARSQSGTALRPSPAKVQTLLAMGASVIAGDVQELTPELRTLSHRLARVFAGLVGANVYCSFGGVQAFDTHFDLHHAFAVQLEGEKTWRLYENRAEAPVNYPLEDAEVRRWFAETRGKLMTEVRMRPGDVLYLPRGQYHDAMTTEGASLHVTFSVTPLYGRILFRLLESAAMQDPAFREWLAPGETQGDRLGQQIAELGRRLADLSALPAFRDEVLMAQERLVPRSAPYALPERRALTFFRPTGLTPPRVTGPARVAVEWALGQPQFALEDVIAQFDFVSEPALNEAFEAAIGLGVFKPV